MSIKTPDFWYRDAGEPTPLIEYALTPLSWLYGAISDLYQNLKTPKAIGVPVVCIGNLTAGGAGKTPTALAVLELLKTHNIAQNPYFLTRGYGGSIDAPTLVDPDTHDYKQVGDEALLLAAKAPTIKSIDRVAGGILAKDNGADFIIMDDGFQNPALHKDISIIVVDGTMGFGNERRIPAGPLRTPIKRGLKQANAVVMIGDNTRRIDPLFCPMISAQIMVHEEFTPQSETPYIAFAGLGYPQKFFDTLKKNAVPVIATHSFADHHPYSALEINALHAQAKEAKARLITTEKDMLRIPPELRANIDVLPITLKWSNEKTLINILKNTIGGAS